MTASSSGAKVLALDAHRYQIARAVAEHVAPEAERVEAVFSIGAGVTGTFKQADWEITVRSALSRAAVWRVVRESGHSAPRAEDSRVAVLEARLEQLRARVDQLESAAAGRESGAARPDSAGPTADELDALGRDFEVSEPDLVATFVAEHPGAIGVLGTARRLIREHFGDVRARLTVVLDAESTTPWRTLYVVVPSALEGPDAVAALDAFDDSWLAHDVERAVCVTLGPL